MPTAVRCVHCQDGQPVTRLDTALHEPLLSRLVYAPSQQRHRLSGFSPTTPSLRHEEFLKSIGATHVVGDSRTLPPAVVQNEVLNIAPGGDLLLVNPEATPAEKKDADNKIVISVFADVQTPATTRDVLVALYS
ncbi:hypothetical protein TRAPUB_10580 [Trametes pubescens]|uniref:Uncharacterized protein n=1 Tax=Trametes pubescens TaxID=154538 RepID=A0A1M2VZ90_TRAPU|nr:hypothetical protein TRAPUB_10580 [Trametes pubescens]